jgi:hypothetical protein
MICRALSGHALEVIGPVYVLEGNDRRITFYCERCDSYRSDTWSIDGRLIKSRYYKLSADYHKFVKEHNRGEARGALLSAQKESKREGDYSGVRLVQAAQKRRRNTTTNKRPRDKKRANA